MTVTASPVFTARVTYVYLVKNRPEHTRVLPGMELKMFFPDAAAEMQQAIPPVERILREGMTDHYVHLHLNGIAADAPPQRLHRLCLLLLIVRDMMTDTLISLSDTEN
jgi:hypothetical protein